MSAERQRHPRHDLDPVLMISPVRLSVITALDEVLPTRYTLVRVALDVSEAVLAHECAKLAAAGYIEVRRDKGDSRFKWLALTATGRNALAKHAAALRLILEFSEQVEHG